MKGSVTASLPAPAARRAILSAPGVMLGLRPASHHSPRLLSSTTSALSTTTACSTSRLLQGVMPQSGGAFNLAGLQQGGGMGSQHCGIRWNGRMEWNRNHLLHSRLFSTSLIYHDSEGAPHFKRSSVQHPLAGKIASIPSEQEVRDKVGGDDYTLPHPIWSREEAEEVAVTHTPPKDNVDKAAYFTVRVMRLLFDLFSGYSWGKMFGTLDEKKWLTRIIFLETVAGVPGMIGAMTRHLKSLRRLQRDHGWIHTLLEEAENERMHLLTALELRNPGPLFKASVVLAQGVFVTQFWIVYAISPRFCHRFVGYLEEEAVKTYSLCLECMDKGYLPMWEKMPAPPIAVNYWKLPEGAMMRDVILAIRADEAHHRVVNHTLSSMDQNESNPYQPGQ